MPSEMQNLQMADSTMSVAEFIGSRPQEARPYLIAAVSDCLRRRCRLNEAELQIAARAIRYAD
jgi:hypothetical protein